MTLFRSLNRKLNESIYKYLPVQYSSRDAGSPLKSLFPKERRSVSILSPMNNTNCCEWHCGRGFEEISQCKNWSMHSYCVSYLYLPLPIGWRFRFSSKWRTRSQDCFRVLYLSVFHCRNNDLKIAMLDYGAILWSVIMKDKNGNAEVRLALICWFRKSRWISRMWMTILPTPVITMERRLEGTLPHLVIPSKICQSNCEGSFHARRKGVLIGYQQRQQQSSWRKRRLGSRRFSHGWWE